MSTVAAILGEPVAAFELGIVAQVFGLDRGDQIPSYDFRVCSSSRGRLVSNGGHDVVATHDIDAVDDADIVVVPGWTTLAAPLHGRVEAAIRAADERDAHVLAICSGSFALAASGILDGRRATTHWQFADLFAASYPAVRFDPNPLYVHDGNVITSAGASAGIDACLHLIRGLHGDETASRLAQQMVTPPHRSGSQAQYMPPLSARRAGNLEGLLDWIDEHLHDPITAADMACVANTSTRTLIRRFRTDLHTTPHRYVTQRRVTLAAQLLEDTDLTVETIASRCGFVSADTLRHHFTRIMQATPTAHRSLYRSSPTSHANR